MLHDLVMAQIAAEQGDLAAARSIMARVRPLFAALPPTHPISPQLALTDAIIAHAERDRAGASAALAKAEAGFAALGPSGSFGLQSVATTRERLAKLP
jgi:hypothetical protein